MLFSHRNAQAITRATVHGFLDQRALNCLLTSASETYDTRGEPDWLFQVCCWTYPSIKGLEMGYLIGVLVSIDVDLPISVSPWRHSQPYLALHEMPQSIGTGT
jgi:hypothetical protein